VVLNYSNIKDASAVLQTAASPYEGGVQFHAAQLMRYIRFGSALRFNEAAQKALAFLMDAEWLDPVRPYFVGAYHDGKE
jgi:hypothetical protein